MKLTRIHFRRLREIYRSAGWPSHDAIEIELLAAGLLARVAVEGGAETLRLTDAGIAQLAQSLSNNRAAFDAHEALVSRVAKSMYVAGRVVWTRLSVRCAVDTDGAQKTTWRVAMPDVFSIRNSSKESMVEPIVHEIKVSRADLLSDLKNPEKRAAYLDISSQAFYVFPEHLADVSEIPAEFGVCVVRNDTIACVRFAPARPCTLRFSLWMALAKARPTEFDESPQSLL